MITKYLIVFLISMVPLIELRGAIPYAVAFHIPTLPAYLIAVIGNMLPVPIIFLFARKVLVWGCDKKYIGKFFTWCLEKGEKGGEKLKAKAGRGLPLALLLFVGIPLPGTGAWTGTLAASILDMDFKTSVLAVMGGVLLASVIMRTDLFFRSVRLFLYNFFLTEIFPAVSCSRFSGSNSVSFLPVFSCTIFIFPLEHSFDLCYTSFIEQLFFS